MLKLDRPFDLLHSLSRNQLSHFQPTGDPCIFSNLYQIWFLTIDLILFWV
jgi:hypothetical protein